MNAIRGESEKLLDHVWPCHICCCLDNDGLPCLWSNLLQSHGHCNLQHAIRKHWNTIDHMAKVQPHNTQTQVSWTKLQRIHGGYLTPKKIGMLLELFMVLGMPLSRCTNKTFWVLWFTFMTMH
jgi:hypothetical protein